MFNVHYKWLAIVSLDTLVVINFSNLCTKFFSFNCEICSVVLYFQIRYDKLGLETVGIWKPIDK